MSAREGKVPKFCFTLARGQNQFFVELAEALAYELHASGASASITFGDAPVPREGLVHIFLPPHEYVALSGYRPPVALLRRSIVICTEQPGSDFFAKNVPLARDAGAVFDINARSARAYSSEGIRVSALEIGYTPLWDRFAIARELGSEADGARVPAEERDIDILFLGRRTPRRDYALALYADVLERFRCHLALSDNSRPNEASAAAFVAGEAKRDLLARSKVLLNVHGEDEPYFEWLRIAEAACAGCAIVSEHSSDVAPLECGRHLVTGKLETLGLFCAWLVDDADRRERMRSEAYSLLSRERPLSTAARQLIFAGREVDATRLDPDALLDCRNGAARLRHVQPPTFDDQPLERLDVTGGEALILQGLKRELLSLVALRRQLDRVEFRLSSGTGERPQTRVIAESPAWRDGSPRVLTAIIPLYNHADEVWGALGSLEQSSMADWEVVVVDDASSDGGEGRVRSWMAARPHLACKLVRHDLNRGLAAARNTGVERARTDRLLMLDADNQVRPIAMGRLMDALDADPDASFAYGIMERYSINGPEGLLSCYDWDPRRLRVSNYIDAFSLIRRDVLSELGGYSYDSRLYGWEDYDLWVRMAETGRHGVFVPEIIASYQVSHSSMISHTNMSTVDAYAALIEHAPTLMADLRVPL
jgi:hypothetical protein